MVDLGYVGLNDLLCSREFLHGDVGLFQLAVVYSVLDKPVHEIRDSLRRIVLKRSGGGLEHVADHKDDLLLGLGLASGIAEIFGLLGRISAVLEELVIEVRHAARAVVGQDEIRDDGRQMVLLCELHSVRDVPDNVLGALGRGEFSVVLYLLGRDQRLVLHEAERVVHLAYVVVERSHLHQRLISSYRTGYGLSQSRHLERVLEGPGSLLFQLAKKFVRILRKLLKTRSADQIEALILILVKLQSIQ